MRTMTRTTAQLDANTAFDTNAISYLLIGGGIVALVAAVVAAIAV